MSSQDDVHRFKVLVIYDIVDNKRRNRMQKCLEGYGVRVQKSAFEAYLNKKLCDDMENKTTKIIDESEDSLRIYLLTGYTSIHSWGVGIHGQESVIIL